MNLGPTKGSERWNQKTLGLVNPTGGGEIALKSSLNPTTVSSIIGNGINVKTASSSTGNGWMGNDPASSGQQQLHGPAHGPKGLLRQSWSPHSNSNSNSNNSSSRTPRANPSLSSPSSSSALAGQSEAALRGR